MSSELREEPGAGFTYLRGALSEEYRARTQLHAYGIDGQDVFNCRVIKDASQAQTDEERSARNYAYGRLMGWQPVVRAGTWFLLGEWVLAQVTARFRYQPVLDMHDWLPGPPELSTRLFDVLAHVHVEALAYCQGHVMQDIPKEREGEQASYLLAGLLRTRLKTSGNVGTRLRRGLAALAGDASYAAIRTQLLRELPGAVRVAWNEGGFSDGLSDLKRRIEQRLERAALNERGVDTALPSQEDAELESVELELTMHQQLAQLDLLEQKASLSMQEHEVWRRVRKYMDIGEIAAELGIPKTQVSVVKHKATEKLVKARKAAGF